MWNGVLRDRRDVFKAVLVVKGANGLYYATHSYIMDQPALVFISRLVPFSWETVEDSGDQKGSSAPLPNRS